MFAYDYTTTLYAIKIDTHDIIIQVNKHLCHASLFSVCKGRERERERERVGGERVKERGCVMYFYLSRVSLKWKEKAAHTDSPFVCFEKT